MEKLHTVNNSTIEKTNQEINTTQPMVLLKTIVVDNITYAIYGPSKYQKNKSSEIDNLFKELDRHWRFLESVEKTLNNIFFIQKANKSIIDNENKKFNDTINKILAIESILYNYLINEEAIT